MANKILLVFAVSLTLAAAYWGPDLPKGPFCGTDGQCCRDRQDGCSHPILGTICYCDEFCNRGREHDDCCPDYEPVCLGQEPPKSMDPCRHNGKIYLPNDQREDNCNTCTCVIVDRRTNQTGWQCTNDPCIISDDVVYRVNRQNLGWRAYNYSQFQGKKLRDGVVYKLGTLQLDPMTRRMNAMGGPRRDAVFPNNFDARQRWPQFISPVRDQGWCGSDWAMSLAAIASDRFAIFSNGAENLMLSAQLLLSCNVRHQQACQGGHIDIAWNFAKNQGLVDEDCFPYKAAKTSCPFKKHATLREDGCRPSVPERTDRYRMSPLGRLKGEKAIMNDIMQSGPLQAIMTVRQDFFHYRDGVYRHTLFGNNEIEGLHSVRIVGWGEDRRQKYWIVANTWGQEWGENGYFRIARGTNESGIEDFVVTVLPEVIKAYQRK